MADHDAPQVAATADTVDFDDTGLSATADPTLEPRAIGPSTTWLVEVAPGHVIMDGDTPVTVVTLAYDLDDEITDFVVRHPDGRLVRITGAGDEIVTLADPTHHLVPAPAHAVVHGLDAWFAGGPDHDELAAADARRQARAADSRLLAEVKRRVRDPGFAERLARLLTRHP